MKHHRKYFLLAGLVLFLFASTGIAFASSSTFFTQAQKFINQNCNKKLLADPTALFCYLFYKSQEQDIAITNMNKTIFPIASEIDNLKNHQSQTDQSISSLQTTQASQASQINNLQTGSGKTIKVTDANGNELGNLVDGTSGNFTLFLPTLNRLVRDQDQNIANFENLYFSTSDCSGTAYLDSSYGGAFTDIILPGTGRYYIVTNNASKTVITMNSLLLYNQTTHQFQCTNPTPTVSSVYPLTQVTLPFSEPIATPLQLKYQ